MVARSAGVFTASVDDDPIDDRTNSAEPRTATEKTFAEVLANILHVDGVPVDSHFFDDLGADSLMMAQFCARVRKRPDLPSVSMKDVYQHPTITAWPPRWRRPHRTSTSRRRRRRSRWRHRPERCK